MTGWSVGEFDARRMWPRDRGVSSDGSTTTASSKALHLLSLFRCFRLVRGDTGAHGEGRRTWPFNSAPRRAHNDGGDAGARPPTDDRDSDNDHSNHPTPDVRLRGQQQQRLTD